MNSFWRDKTVLVTGATGFMGRWLTEALLSAGASVTALTRRTEHPPGPVRWLTGSIADPDRLNEVFAASSPGIVFHLAAQSLTGGSDAAAALEANTRGTWLVLDACRRFRVRSVIHASSWQARATACVSPYQASKQCADVIAAMYRHQFHLPVLTLRFSNVYGGGDENGSRLVPGAMRAALRGEPFVIRGDGRSVRDLLYIDDAVDALLRAGQRAALHPSEPVHCFDIASGESRTVLEITESILEILGCAHLRPVIAQEVPGEERLPQRDLAGALQYLGWLPRTGLPEGLRKTADWYRRQSVPEAPLVRASASGGHG